MSASDTLGGARAAEASKNLLNVKVAPTCWIAAVSAAEEILAAKNAKKIEGGNENIQESHGKRNYAYGIKNNSIDSGS